MRTAIILFNLGGPDRLDAVKPFLFNLFNDPAIIGLPQPLRWMVAQLISSRRAPTARSIYEHMGGRSPIVANTEEQARALDALLGLDFKCFIAMRYWHPRARGLVAAVKQWAPDRVLLLPLYPQFSTTTTASSVREWQREAARVGLTVPTTTLCCYPDNAGFVTAVANGVRRGLAQFDPTLKPRVLFSAHGLPKKVIDAGDPYQEQVERSVAAVLAELAMPALDWVICYQSRVGPLEWIGPSTEAEVRRGGADVVPLLVVPIAFVSDHSETLVELDIEYRTLAEERGVPAYVRVPTVGADADFIAGLADEVRRAIAAPEPIRSSAGHRICSTGRSGCPCGQMGS
ncbi:ferrochelatase [Aliidongia dinghuensis]|uniref:Ferrochelatase n=1 Tax=Aliidongia dinghuensis TaxID=1867774 RepID=A0A8J2YWJ6_9PROT|nr:ferrochelatase [Aliidongia dinghuensis]GGF32597.1 ferrochelatase [Aliidongia dinghuensis]